MRRRRVGGQIYEEAELTPMTRNPRVVPIHKSNSGHLKVSNSETRYFLQDQGNQGIPQKTYIEYFAQGIPQIDAEI